MINLTLKQFRYFEALARQGHFGRAAETCAISQPALSMQIREMEETLGTELFERGARQVRLTSFGQDLALRIRPILRAVDELEDLGETVLDNFDALGVKFVEVEFVGEKLDVERIFVLAAIQENPGAYTHYQARYGIPAGDTYIDMRQNKAALGSSLKSEGATLQKIDLDAGYADYSHSEIDPADGAVLATFKNKEWDGRAEALFGQIGPFTGSAVGQIGRAHV